MIPHKAQPRQSLLDAAIAATGSIEAAYDIALANGLPLTKVFLSPQKILVPAVRGSVRLLQQPPCTGIDPDTPVPEPEPDPEPDPDPDPEPDPDPDPGENPGGGSAEAIGQAVIGTTFVIT